MVRSFGPSTSRVLDLDAKSLQLLVARSGKAITDAEGILIQDLQALKINQLVSTLTYSGCIDLPQFKIEHTGPSSNYLVIPPFRALINNEYVMVRGTANPNYPFENNYVAIPPAPATAYGVTVVYLEAWYQLLDELAAPLQGSLIGCGNQGFYPNYSTTFNKATQNRYYFPYGNILADVGWITQPQFLDDLADPIAGYTSGRVQIQYALRATQINPTTGVAPLTNYIRDFGVTHPGLHGRTFLTPTSSNFDFAGSKDPGLFICSNNSLKTVDGNTYSIPLAILYQRNTSIWDPISNPHGTSSTGGGGSWESRVSGRPDGRFHNIVCDGDVLDTRSTFLGGSLEDYQSLIEQTASRLWNGALRLKIAEPPSSDTNAHQTGQTLVSHEYLGVDTLLNTAASVGIGSPIANISSNSEPHMSWSADACSETMTLRVTQTMKDVPSSGVVPTNTTTWESGDQVTLPYPNSVATFETASVYTYNRQAQILKVPPAYLLVSGVGSNTLKLQILNLGLDPRFDLSKPLWVVTTMRKNKSFEHLRFVPEQMHTPLFVDPLKIGAAILPCGSVSDYAPAYQDVKIPGSPNGLRSYKRNYDPNLFGTVRTLQVRVRDLTPVSPQDPLTTTGAPTISFGANANPIETLATVLTWNVASATSVTLKNMSSGVSLGEVPLSGSIALQILQPTTFLLTARNGSSPTSTLNNTSTQTIIVNPPSDTSASSILTGQGASRTYVAPGGSLNPENISAPYSVAVDIPMSPGFGDTTKHVLAGCIKATLFQIDALGTFESSQVQIRHQYFHENASSTGLIRYEIGVFGQWANPDDRDYIEFEILVTGEKTIHYNPTVQGITGVTETVALSQNPYLYFSEAQQNELYSLSAYSNYSASQLEVAVSVPCMHWSDTLKVGGIFEGVFGYDGQSYVFVKMSNDYSMITETYYRAVPCTVRGIGTALLHITIPQITLALVQDILVLAQTSTTLSPTSTTLVSYDYIPYQGEGDSEETYSLEYLENKALVTTFGTGSRSIPGIQSVSSTNPLLPISTLLPSATGWHDSDLACARFQLSGSYSGTGNSSGSSTDFIQTIPVNTVVGNIKHLISVSANAFPALSPRSPAQRGFSNNTVAFAYAIEAPTVISSPVSPTDQSQNDMAFWVDMLVGDDSNHGISKDLPKRTLQAVLSLLPAVIKHKMTINVNGTTALSMGSIPNLNTISVTPYGNPSQDHVYSMVHTDFNTQGNGVVIIQRDPSPSDMASLQIPATTPFMDSQLYGWLHSGGKLVIEGFEFNSAATQGVSLAVYPGTDLVLNNCSFNGGYIQLLNYGAVIECSGTTFSLPLMHSTLVTSGGSLVMGSGMAFAKLQINGYTFVVEKNSSLLIKDKFTAMSYPTYDSLNPHPEFLIRQYSILDTHLAPSFEFFHKDKSVDLASFSSLIYNTAQWYGTLFHSDASSITISNTATY